MTSWTLAAEYGIDTGGNGIASNSCSLGNNGFDADSLGCNNIHSARISGVVVGVINGIAWMTYPITFPASSYAGEELFYMGLREQAQRS
jgi:hypothetical protein